MFFMSSMSEFVNTTRGYLAPTVLRLSAKSSTPSVHRQHAWPWPSWALGREVPLRRDPFGSCASVGLSTRDGGGAPFLLSILLPLAPVPPTRRARASACPHAAADEHL